MLYVNAIIKGQFDKGIIGKFPFYDNLSILPF